MVKSWNLKSRVNILKTWWDDDINYLYITYILASYFFLNWGILKELRMGNELSGPQVPDIPCVRAWDSGSRRPLSWPGLSLAASCRPVQLTQCLCWATLPDTWHAKLSTASNANHLSIIFDFILKKKVKRCQVNKNLFEINFSGFCFRNLQTSKR